MEMERIIFVRLLLRMCVWTSVWTSVCGCAYLYTSQPPMDLACNPYLVHKTLRLECAVVGADLDSIEWYYSSPERSSLRIKINNSSKYILTRNHTQEKIVEWLTVRNLSQENDIGRYWCQAFLIDGTNMLSPSSLFDLRKSRFYSQKPCNRYAYISSSTVKCADQIDPSTTTTPTHTTNESISSQNYEITEVYTTNTPILTSIPPRLPNFDILYIIIGFFALLFIICIILLLIIILLCNKRNHTKENDIIMEFKNDICNKSDTSLKRTDFAAFRSNLSLRSEMSKNSSGDYAEIGPALMTNVRLHCNVPHYSEINESMIIHPPAYPITEATGEEQNEDIDNKYDLPVFDPECHSESVDHSTQDSALLTHNYSRLKRMESFADVNNDSDTIDLNQCGTLLETPHVYHTLEQAKNRDTSDNSSTDLADEHELSHVMPEHTYHILEKTNTLCSKKASHESVTEKPANFVSPTAVSQENDYDQLVDPRAYNNIILDYSLNNCPLELPMLECVGNDLAKVELSSEIFDDSQYMGVPKKVKNYRLSAGSSKYCGDYERDPVYMERFQTSAGISVSLPNIYQPVKISAMNPIQHYENYKVNN